MVFLRVVADPEDRLNLYVLTESDMFGSRGPWSYIFRSRVSCGAPGRPTRIWRR